MYLLLKEAKEYVKYKKCVIDNFTFWLHYRVAFAALLIASLLTKANELVGGKINCMVEHVPNDVINSYCWIQGTFTIPSQKNEKNVIHSGVSSPTAADNPYNDITYHDTEDKMHHAWYQWVSFILFGQALLFYIPHYLWKATEGGRLAAIVKDLDGFTIKGDTEKKEDDETKKKETRLQDVADYLEESKGTHNLYAWFIVFEFLNLINVVMQAYLMDRFLGNEFTLYGSNVLDHYWQPAEERVDPMSKVFPRVTKCTFKQHGTSGSNENWDAMCILPINMINEKIYIIMWFGFIGLIIWTAVHLMIQMIIACNNRCRVKSLLNKLAPFDVDRKWLNEKTRENYGDYVLLRHMASFMDPRKFKKLMELLPSKVRNGAVEV